MIQRGSIVCGGGWKERPEEYFIKFKAVCCLVLFLPAVAATPSLTVWVGEWYVAVPAALIVASLFFFYFERAQVCWGPSDLRMPDLDRPVFGQQTGSSNLPKYDPHNLY